MKSRKLKFVIFLGSALILLVILIWVSIWAILYIKGTLDKTNEGFVGNSSPTKFEFEKLEKIGIIKSTE